MSEEKEGMVQEETKGKSVIMRQRKRLKWEEGEMRRRVWNRGMKRIKGLRWKEGKKSMKTGRRAKRHEEEGERGKNKLSGIERCRKEMKVNDMVVKKSKSEKEKSYMHDVY